MSEHNHTTEAVQVDEAELSLLDLGIILAKHKGIIAKLTGIAVGLAVAVTLLLPNIYTGTTKILPPQQSSSAAAAMLSQLGGLASLAGGIGGIKNPSDTYVGMLKSRTVADSLIRRFDLMAVYDEEYLSNTRKELSLVTSIMSGKDGIVTIEVDDEDPKRAADLANAYVDELLKLTTVLAVTDAAQRRLFFERQLQQAKEKLTQAEAAAKSAIDRGGLSNVEAQGRAALELTARLRGQISVKEVQISAMRGFAAAQNPNLRIAEQELAALKAELAKIDGTRTNDASPAHGSEGFVNLGLVRDVKYHEVVFELLAKQFELAKLDEAKESSVVQVMDVAVAPDRKSKPKRAIIVLLATIAGFLTSLIVIFVKETWANSKKDPLQSKRISELREHMRI